MSFERMRGLLLNQAIHGRLVSQEADDGAVKQIGMAPDAEPFTLPKSWRWINIKELVIPTKQTIPVENFTYIDVSSIKNFHLEGVKKLEPSNAPSRARKVVQAGVVLFATVRPYLKNICIAPTLSGNVIASTAFATMSCSDCLINRYLFYVLRSDYFTELVKGKQRGISYPAISERDFYACHIPVPPVKEQIRIVAKLEEAFAEINRAEKAYEELQTLAGVLRGQILQEAIQGKLVPQLESEPEVEQIGEAPEEVPFEIPKKWKWMSFDCVVKTFPSKNYQIQTKEIALEGKYPVISQAKAKIDGYCDDESKLIPKDKIPFVIFGDHTRVVKFVNQQCVIGADGTKLLRSDVYDISFLFYVIVFLAQNLREAGYSRHFKFLKARALPVPPLAEQRRIVARVNELLSLLDELH